MRFLTKDSAEEIHETILDVMKPETYREMKAVAEEKGMLEFSYRSIAERSVR